MPSACEGLKGYLEKIMAKKKKKRKHKPDPPSWLIKRNRKHPEHITNCHIGYHRDTKSFRQVHHIVCISSVSDKTILKMLQDKDKGKYIGKCLKITKWDINDGDNVVGLPLKQAFVRRSGELWNRWPCHTVDHTCNDGYLHRVNVDLKEKVWDPAIEVGEECELNGEDLAEQLKKRSRVWLGFLIKRGRANGGTKYCWENRIEIYSGELVPPDGLPWYYPFSMHPGTPSKRKPPPRWEDFSKNFQDAMAKLFKAIK